MRWAGRKIWVRRVVRRVFSGGEEVGVKEGTAPSEVSLVGSCERKWVGGEE